MVIVYTTVWIDYLAAAANPQTQWLDTEVGNQPIGLTDIILCEVLQGIRDDLAFARVRRDLMRFDVFDSGGSELALASAENYRYLRSKGITVRKTIDCLIATFCIEKGHALLHRDRDFDAFEKHSGLHVIHP
jgi:predicted nucleic acid-binding protein